RKRLHRKQLESLQRSIETSTNCGRSNNSDTSRSRPSRSKTTFGGEAIGKSAN
ncbi:silent information regulator protein Sir2, partial [Enterococcus faecalis]